MVHNTSALIEKYSADNQLFQWYNPTKRRLLDTCIETATTTKKMVKIELDEQPVTHAEQMDISDIGVTDTQN